MAPVIALIGHDLVRCEVCVMDDVRPANCKAKEKRREAMVKWASL